MKPHFFPREANDEYLEALRANQSHLGRRFYFEIERGLKVICTRPQLWPCIERDARRFLCSVFPYALIYRDTPERVIIVAVMPLKRKPFYWRNRLA